MHLAVDRVLRAFVCVDLAENGAGRVAPIRIVEKFVGQLVPFDHHNVIHFVSMFAQSSNSIKLTSGRIESKSNRADPAQFQHKPTTQSIHGSLEALSGFTPYNRNRGVFLVIGPASAAIANKKNTTTAATILIWIGLVIEAFAKNCKS